MERFIESIHKIYPLPEDDLKRLLSEAEEIELSKGDRIIHEGQINKSVYLIKEGVLRGYYINQDREITIWFVVAGEPAFSSWGFVDGKPSQVTIEATCNCKVLHYSKEQIEQFFLASMPLAMWVRKMFENLLLTSDQWLVDFTKPLASERYLALANKMPEILKNVSLKDIAGFLGMTPQSLSRIRAEIVKKK